MISHIHSYGYAVVIRPYASFLSHAEAVAPKVSEFLYGTADPEKLTAEQKDTVANIMSLAGAGVGVAVGNTSANAVSGSLNAEGAVENNNSGAFLDFPSNYTYAPPTKISDNEIWIPEDDQKLNENIKDFEEIVRLIPLVDVAATSDEKLQQWNNAKTLEEKLAILKGLPETVIERAITAKAEKLWKMSKVMGHKSKEFLDELDGLNDQLKSSQKLATANGAKVPNNATASKQHNAGGSGKKAENVGASSGQETSRYQGTVHGDERLAGRGFSQERLQNIVENYSEKGYQSGGKTVYIQKRKDGYYDVLVLNSNNMVVTAVGGTIPPDKFSLPNRKTVMKMLNNNGGFSGLPVQ